MLTMLRSLIPLLRYHRGNTNEEENEQREERAYPRRYPTKRYLNAEKWQICHSLGKEFTSQMDMIMPFDDTSALIKSKDNMVYGVGTNLNGRLGLSNTNHDYINPERVEALCGKNIITFHCSADEICFFALTIEGKVYCWGMNERCRLGKQLGTTNTYTPFKIDSLSEERIIDIACNTYNCLALTDSGKVYIWGSIDFTNNILQDKPHKVGELKMEEIVQIACGTSFVMALSKNGKLYSWGGNENGQLGIKTESDICVVPCLIASLEKVKIAKIVCGSEHSLALTFKGKIYSWGNNVQGQLGHGETYELKKKPRMLNSTAMGTISDITAQRDASAAVNKLGSVYRWGSHDHTIWKPIKFECWNMYNVFRYKIPYIIYDITRELEIPNTIFDDQLTSDLTIKVKGKCIYVHKSVLIRCDYFKNMSQNGWREVRKNTIKYNDFPYNTYKSFFKCLYTDAVDNLPLEETFELLKLCDKYSEKDVAEKYVEVIKDNLNVSNVALCFAIATERKAEMKSIESGIWHQSLPVLPLVNNEVADYFIESLYVGSLYLRRLRSQKNCFLLQKEICRREKT